MTWRLLWLVPIVLLIPLTVTLVGGILFGLPRPVLIATAGVVTGVVGNRVASWAIPRKETS